MQRTCIASLAGRDTKNAQLLARFFRTNFINTIVPKNSAPKTCQSFQTRGHGTCIASLVGSETKKAELLHCWHGFSRTNSINAIGPKNWCQRLLKRCLNAGKGTCWTCMHGKKFFAGGVFILHGVLSVDAWFSKQTKREPKHRICISVNGQVRK